MRGSESSLALARPAGRLARLTPQMSGSVRKSFCASRHQTPVMPHLRSQSPTLQNVFCLAVVSGDRIGFTFINFQIYFLLRFPLSLSIPSPVSAYTVEARQFCTRKLSCCKQLPLLAQRRKLPFASHVHLFFRRKAWGWWARLWHPGH